MHMLCHNKNLNLTLCNAVYASLGVKGFLPFNNAASNTNTQITDSTKQKLHFAEIKRYVQYKKQHQRNLIHSNVTSNRVSADLKLLQLQTYSDNLITHYVLCYCIKFS
jgi:hypothetical protein